MTADERIEAPAPTTTDGKGGKRRLSPAFIDWMVGLEPGHITNPENGLMTTIRGILYNPPTEDELSGEDG